MSACGSGRGVKVLNGYAVALGRLYGEAPKAVLAAVAVSALTVGGDYLEQARERVAAEWWALYDAGVVPQRPAGCRCHPGLPYREGCPDRQVPS